MKHLLTSLLTLISLTCLAQPTYLDLFIQFDQYPGETSSVEFDTELLETIYPHINVPLIINGGCGKIEDITAIQKEYENVSFSIASAFHYKKISIKDLKNEKNLYS